MKAEKTSPSEWPMRINKYLALKNHSTRRGGDELIKKHQVLINGRYAVLGDKVAQTDAVEVRGNKRNKENEYVYYAYNKPAGVATLAPKEGGKGIKESIDLKNVFPVGRLDKDSHGLIILTNDGRVTDRLLNPKHVHDKEYIVKVKDKLRSSFKDKMAKGVNIEGYVTEPCKIHIIDESTFSIILTEGKKHQIRRMCVALFQEVKDLKRVRIMNINLGKVAPNSYKEIKGDELNTFLHSLALI